MKKILLMAVVAVAFMACKSNGADMPKADKSAMSAVTTNAVSQLGESSAKVEKNLVDAGFVKVKGGKLPTFAPALKKAQLKAADGAVQVMYAYNLPENYGEMDEEEAVAYINKIMAKGETCIMVAVSFEDDELSGMATAYIVPVKKNINLFYTEISDDLYSQLPKQSAWVGYAAEPGEKEGDEYLDHKKFVSKVAAAEAIQTEESAECLNYGYAGVWANPDEEQQAELEKAGFTTPIAIGAYMIANEEFSF